MDDGVRTNLASFLDYEDQSADDSLADLPVVDSGLMEEGGGPTHIYDRWIQAPIEVKKYIDDVSGVEKIHAGHLYNSKFVDGHEHRFFHAPQAQELFERVRRGATEKGMQLNPSKTVMLCVSAATSYRARSFVRLPDDDVVLSSKKCRLLGFHFDESPGVAAHVKEILKKVRYRIWSIHHLKRLGLCISGLINVYVSLVRPCFDYACVVYHPMLTKTQSNQLERMQRKVMKIIFGFDTSYERCLSRAGIDSLSYRRQQLCERFALKTARNPAFAHWFPESRPSEYAIRSVKKYREFPARTKRLRAAPLYMFRRMLNFIAEEDSR